jgi:membrane protein
MTKNIFQRIKKLSMKIYSVWEGHDISVYSAFFSYYMLISFFPFLLISIVIVSYTPLVDVSKLQDVLGYLPNTVYTYIENLIDENLLSNRKSIISFSVFGIIWASSKAFTALITVINRAYRIENKSNYFVKILNSIFFSLIMAVIFVVYILVIILGNNLSKYILYKIGYLNIYSDFSSLFKIVVPILLAFILSIYIYYIVPKRAFKLKEIIPGSLFLTFGFFILTYCFSIYFNNFTNYSKVYGGLAGIVVLLLWLNLLSTVIMIGAELNSVLKFGNY